MRQVDKIAWAAGFFEGEGTFYAHYYKSRNDGTRVFRTNASLVQKDEDLIQKFCDVVGFGITYGPTSKGIFTWKTSRLGEAQKLLDLLRPWLGKRRINTAETLLKEESYQIFRPLKSHCKNNHRFTPENTKQRVNGSGRICLQCVKDRNDRRHK